MGNPYTPEEQQRIVRNRERLVSLVQGFGQPRRVGKERTLGLELERLVVDTQTGEPISYLDDPGIYDLLEQWTAYFTQEDQVFIDGRLFGFAGKLLTPQGTIDLSITLEPGSQLEASIGPATTVTALMAGLEAFDDQFHDLCKKLGVDWELIALGVNPLCADPLDVALLPKERYRLMDAYLSARGRYARDMMRLSASTQVSIDCGHPCDLARIYQLAVALGPIFSFLCDNTLSWRGLAPQDTPRMARSRIWQWVDPARCGTVPGTFRDDFCADTYVEWLLNVRPILFTNDAGFTVSTGNATVRDVLAVHELTSGELAHLLSMVFPNTRLKGFLEIRDADSLPPRLAGAFAALVKGLFYDATSFETAFSLFAKERSDSDIPAAHQALRNDGWDAHIYGLPMNTVVSRIIQLTENGLGLQEERELFHGLSDLWTRRLVPRDVLMRS